jgi:acyl-CoA hydrolase
LEPPENVTDSGVAHLRGLTALQHLDLNECIRVTDSGVTNLRGLTVLQHLDLG